MYPVNTNKLIVTSKFGPRTYTYQGKQISDYHKGIDLVGGSEIIAFADGVVTGICNSGKQYGQACYVRIKHNNKCQTLYYHLKSGSVCVSIGQYVKKGQKLGIMGATGQATGIHLHFQIDNGNSASAIDPYDYIFNGKDLPQDIEPKTNEQIAREVMAGKWGNNPERRTRLEQAGYDYNTIQALVNKFYNKDIPVRKTNEEIAHEVIMGKWGNNPQRRIDITNAGYDYNVIQQIVNKLMK